MINPRAYGHFENSHPSVRCEMIHRRSLPWPRTPIALTAPSSLQTRVSGISGLSFAPSVICDRPLRGGVFMMIWRCQYLGTVCMGRGLAGSLQLIFLQSAPLARRPHRLPSFSHFLFVLRPPFFSFILPSTWPAKVQILGDPLGEKASLRVLRESSGRISKRISGHALILTTCSHNFRCMQSLLLGLKG